MNNRVITAVVALLIIVSCGPKPQNLLHDESFTGTALREGGIGLLGTVGRWPLELLEREAQHPYDSMLFDQITSSVPDVPVLTVDATGDLLSDRLFDRLRYVLDDNDDIDSASQRVLARFSGRLPAYLLLIRRVDTKYWKERSSGTTSRYLRIKARMLIYETRTGKLVSVTDLKKDQGFWGKESLPLRDRQVMEVIYRLCGEELAKLP